MFNFTLKFLFDKIKIFTLLCLLFSIPFPFISSPLFSKEEINVSDSNLLFIDNEQDIILSDDLTNNSTELNFGEMNSNGITKTSNRIEKVEAEFAQFKKNSQNRPPYLIQYRTLNLNTSLLEKIVIIKDSNTLPKVILNLFKEINLEVKFSNITIHDNKTTLIGKIKDEPFSIVVLTMTNNSLAGEVDSLTGSFSIKPIGKNISVIYQTNPNNPKKDESKSLENDFLEPSQNIKEGQNSNPEEGQTTSIIANSPYSNEQTGNFIDVMILYTQSVEDSSSDIVSEINTDIDYANQVLAKSCIKTRLRLVKTQKLSYEETGSSSSDLLCITNQSQSSCGQNYSNAKSISTLRDTYGADLIQLWVQTNQDYCGIGWAPSISSLASQYGFSIKLHSCSASTTIHELGHNLSLQHDRFQSQVSMYNYGASNGEGYGHVITSLKIRDIMSYDTECTASGVSCSRIPYFSNPRIIYEGFPFGIAGISDASKRINSSRTLVANYKQATSDYNPDVTSGCEEVNSKPSSTHPCLLATISFGSPIHEKVLKLRKFRDQFLVRFSIGQDFIEWYYKYSPIMGKFLEQNSYLIPPLRLVLTFLLFNINNPYLIFLMVLTLSGLITYLLFQRKYHKHL